MKTTIKALLIIVAMFVIPSAKAIGVNQCIVSPGPTFTWGGNINGTAPGSLPSGTTNCVTIDLPSTAAVITLGATGTWSATLAVEESQDNGVTYTSAGTSITTNGTTSYVVAGFTQFRVRATAYVSGVANINLQVSAAPSGSVTSGTADPTGTSCSPNALYVQTTTGNLYTCDAGVFAIVSGGGAGCVPAGSAGEVLFDSGSGTCAESTNFTWNNGTQILQLNGSLGDEITFSGEGIVGVGSSVPITAPQILLQSATVTLGVSGSASGELGFLGSTSGTCTLTANATATSIASSCNITGLTSTLAFPVTVSGTTVSGGIPYFSSTTALSSSALLAANQLVLGGGAGTAPATLGSLGTTTTVLHGNAAGAPSFGAVNLAADVSGQLPISAVGSSGLSGTSPIAISAAGAISCATCPNIDLTAAGSTWYPFGIWGPVAGTASSFSLTSGNNPQMYLVNIPVTAKVTNILTATAGGSAATTGDVGMYSISGTTLTLSWHTGSFATTSNNTLVSVTLGAPVTLSPGKYYVATCNSSTTPTLPGVIVQTSANNVVVASTSPAHTWGVNATDTCTAGVLPNTQTSTNITNSAGATVNGAFIKITN